MGAALPHIGMVVLAMSSCCLIAAQAGDQLMGERQMRSPDGRTVCLYGNGMQQDTVSLAVQAAARLLGRDADYQTTYCRSTNAFSPAIDPGETCTSWWHVGAWLGTKQLRPLAASLGLRARLLRLPRFEGDESSPAAQESYRRAVATAVHDQMAAGSIVLIEREWETSGPHGFVPWAWAGIVTAARPQDGTMLGACLNGHEDNRIAFIEGAWVLSTAVRATPSLEVDLEMLRQVVARIYGEGAFRRSRRAVYGLEAMDLWIRQMATVPGFCAVCQERSQRGWSDARDNGVTADAGAAAAATYLRRMGAFPTASRRHLDTAAERYDHIRELLRPALSGQGGETYEQFVGDLAKQQAHVEGVLRPIRAELSLVAGDLENALNSAH